VSDEFTVPVPVRYRDLDPMGHVNNGVYASYLEEVRTAYIETVLEGESESLSFVVANLEISYRSPIQPDDEPTVSLRIVDLGTTSCTMAHEIRVDGEVTATAETVLVHVDSESHEPTPFEEAVRERLCECEGLEPSPSGTASDAARPDSSSGNYPDPE
jgi:acyl-CoA thioester hydrolase